MLKTGRWPTQPRFSFLWKKLHSGSEWSGNPYPARACIAFRTTALVSGTAFDKIKVLALHTEEACLQAALWPGLTTVGCLPSGFFWADSSDCLSSRSGSWCAANVGNIMSVSGGLSTFVWALSWPFAMFTPGCISWSVSCLITSTLPQTQPPLILLHFTGHCPLAPSPVSRGVVVPNLNDCLMECVWQWSL